MSFQSKNLQAKRRGMGFIKGATLFFLGMSCVLFIARAFDIVPVVPNAVQYISKVFLTNDGSNTSATGILLDGTTNGGVTITNLPNKVVLGTDANGKLIASTSGDIYNFIRGLILQSAGATGADGTNGMTGHSVVINIVTTGAIYTNGQCAGTGNIISFYADSNDNFAYNNGDTLLGSTIMCSDGATGPQGAKGATGANGVNGINGTSVTSGYVNNGTLYLQYSGVNGTGTWTLGSIQGATGVNGINGMTGHSVVINIVTTGAIYTNGQCAGTGNIISFYADSNDNFVYNNGDTLLGAVIMCSDGATGPKGDQGIQGATGADGAQGIQGVKGATGADGAQGIQGVKGATGADGAQGIQGVKGATGADGAQGIQGVKGATGADGVQGIQGIQGPTGFLQAGSPTGVTPYRNGSSWITSSTNIYNDGTTVGIGIVPSSSAYKININGNMLFTNAISREIKMQDANYNYGLSFSILGSNSFGQINSNIGTIGGHIYVRAGLGASVTDNGGDGGNVYVNGGSYGIGVRNNGRYGQVIIANEGGKVAVGTNTATAMLTVEGGIRPILRGSTITYDPCQNEPGNYPIGTVFYVTTEAGHLCFCNNAGYAKRVDNPTYACDG